jgi:hypothetical protein
MGKGGDLAFLPPGRKASKHTPRVNSLKTRMLVKKTVLERKKYNSKITIGAKKTLSNIKLNLSYFC